jgi:aspartyl-tRNA(Asn)/glutamyl-tRNA(Gln) amidotransferase subunit C
MIDAGDIAHIADLARLELSDAEKESFARQLDAVLQYVRQLDDAPTRDVGPTCFVAPGHDPVRDDVEQPSLPREKALANGPSVKKGFFAIPKVISQ